MHGVKVSCGIMGCLQSSTTSILRVWVCAVSVPFTWSVKAIRPPRRPDPSCSSSELMAATRCHRRLPCLLGGERKNSIQHEKK